MLLRCCLRCFCISLSALIAICSVAAVEVDDEPFAVLDDLPADISVQVSWPEDPLPVEVVPQFPEEIDVPSGLVVAAIGDQLPDSPPAAPVFYGSGYVSGYDSNRGNITIYCPIDYHDGTWGLDRNGYLYNVSSKSLSGYLAGVYNNSWSASSFNYPTYRIYSGSTYTTYTLYLRPSASNCEIASTMVPRRTESQLLPYVSILLLGVIAICCIKRFSRS